MRLQVNEKSEIIGYAKKGGLSDSIEFTGAIPDNFEEEFKPYFFIIKNNTIIENSNYVKPTDTPPDDGPTSVQQVVMQMSATITQMQQLIMSQEREIAELKGGTK